MSDTELSFEGFLQNVNPLYQEAVQQINVSLLQNGCTIKFQLAKSGYVVSYSMGKKVLLNFVFRKSGLLARIYGDHVGAYADLLETLPSKMVKSIETAPVCRLCNPRCGKGYVFTLKSEQQQKCRYNCFLFAVDDESIPFIKSLLEHEGSQRSA